MKNFDKKNSSDASPSILIVDDKEQNIHAMKKLLADYEINVISALSGEEALSHVLRTDFALIYLDVQMPGMNGYEVAKLLKENDKFSHIPIVFVTAIYDDIEHVEKGYESGAIDYLTKPINPFILRAKTNILLRLHEQNKSLQDLVQRLEEIAMNDALTGLSNRFQFNEFFEKMLSVAIRNNKKLALYLLDIDNFKAINDSYGHHVGDKYLKAIAERLSIEMKDVDFIARIGGDEFAILLLEVESINQVSNIANKLLRTITGNIDIERYTIKSTVSLGIAMYPHAGNDVNELFKSADIAMYKAKSEGKNTFKFFTDELNDTYERKSTIEQSFEKAMKAGDIKSYYQPRVDISTNKMIGVEALARWHHNILGDIPPFEFIQIAEEFGFINELGDYLLKDSLCQAAEWQKSFSDYNLKVSINLSPFQLSNFDIIKTVKNYLDVLNINPEYIEFELTESVFKGPQDTLTSILDAITAMGIRISIDDFGTGFSSLSRLKTLPISSLKIDQSFIRDIYTDNNDKALVRAIIALADALNIGVIAEGIETIEHAEFVLKNGCVEGQGYLYSKPVPPDSIENLIKDGGLFKAI